MRLGCCGSLDQAGEIKAAGFDFLEVPVQAVLCAELDDAQWSKTAPDPAKLPLPIEAANVLLPGSLPVIGPKRDVQALTRYLRTVARRAKQVGIQRIVFGSGGARKRPEGVDRHTADDHLAEFCAIAGDACADHGVLLVIEHLNAGETNTLNKLAQTAALCERVNHPAVTLLVDSYHYGLEHEDDEALLALGDRVRHVHVAEVDGRWQPAAGKGKPFDFEHFFCLLHKIGYRERVSIEAKWSEPIATAGPACVAFLRQAWDAAGRCE